MDTRRVYTTFIVAVYIVSHSIVWSLLGTRGRGNGGELPDRYVRIGGSSVEIDMCPGNDIQTHRARNTQPHDDGI